MARFEALIADEEAPAFDNAVWRFLSGLVGPAAPDFWLHRYPWTTGDRRVIESDDEAALTRLAIVLDVELLMMRSTPASY